MSYGDEGGAIGYLVGEEHRGMRAMFTMMNSARIAVGVQGVAIGDAAYQKALVYSQERVQGSEIGGDTPGAVADHPPPRRAPHAAVHEEPHRGDARPHRLQRGGHRPEPCTSRATRPRAGEEVAELLTPVTKAWCTDVGMEVTSTAVQVFGGMGFIEEAGVSQHFRDMRIAPIYEGTNGIQAMDLVGRKLAMRMGGVVTDHLDRIRATVAELAEAGDEFDSMRAELSASVETLSEVTNWIMTNGLADPVEALSGATPYLRIFGIVTGGWLLARQALAAQGELNAGSEDKGYLSAKITTARYYAEQHLPQAAGLVPMVQAGSKVLYEVDAETLASV